MISNVAPTLKAEIPGFDRLPGTGELVARFAGKYPLPEENISELVSLWRQNARYDRETKAVWLNSDALYPALGGGMITSFVELCLFTTKKENLRTFAGKTCLRGSRVNDIIDLRVSLIEIGRAKPEPAFKEFIEATCSISKELNEKILHPRYS